MLVLFILLIVCLIIIIIISYKESLKVHDYGFKFSINQPVFIIYNDRLTEGIVEKIVFTKMGVTYVLYLSKYDKCVSKTKKFIVADKHEQLKLLNDL